MLRKARPKRVRGKPKAAGTRRPAAGTDTHKSISSVKTLDSSSTCDNSSSENQFVGDSSSKGPEPITVKMEPDLVGSWAQHMESISHKGNDNSCNAVGNPLETPPTESELAPGFSLLQYREGKGRSDSQNTPGLVQNVEQVDSTSLIDNEQAGDSSIASDSVTKSKQGMKEVTTSENSRNERVKRLREIVTALVNAGLGPNSVHGSDQPLNPNTNASTLIQIEKVTENITEAVEPSTVEELTARQLRAVFDYIMNHNIIRDQVLNLAPPVRKPSTVRATDFEEAVKISYLVQNLRQLCENTKTLLCELAKFLTGRHPLKHRYVQLMAWIHELHHSITAISVNREQLQQIILPKFFDVPLDREYFISALSVFHIHRSVLKETLYEASAITAHATRMIRYLEGNQTAHIISRQIFPATEDDIRYFEDSATNMPPKLPNDPTSYIHTPQWWHQNYSDDLKSSVSGEYLRNPSHGSQYESKKPTAAPSEAVLRDQVKKSRPVSTSSSPVQSAASNTQPLGATMETAELEEDPVIIFPRVFKRKSEKTNPSPSNQFSSTSASRHLWRAPSAHSVRGSQSNTQHRPTSIESKKRKHERTSSEQRLETSLAKSKSYTSVNDSSFERRKNSVQQYSLSPVFGSSRENVHQDEQHMRAIPPAKVGPCAFCSARGHFSSDCTKFPWLSERAHLCEKFGLCSNCLKEHYGSCIRQDPCSICHKKGHHRAFCMRNQWVKLDVRQPEDAFYEELQQRTYKAPPPGVVARQPYSQTYREAQKNNTQSRFQTSFTSGSVGESTPHSTFTPFPEGQHKPSQRYSRNNRESDDSR